MSVVYTCKGGKRLNFLRYIYTYIYIYIKTGELEDDNEFLRKRSTMLLYQAPSSTPSDSRRIIKFSAVSTSLKVSMEEGALLWSSRPASSDSSSTSLCLPKNKIEKKCREIEAERRVRASEREREREKRM